MRKVIKSFRKSAIRAPNKFYLKLLQDFHFSSIANKHCWALKPFLKPHWYTEENLSKKFDICLN